MRCYDIDTQLNDLRRLNWQEKTSSSGTSGMFLKAVEVLNGKKVYYKLSNYDSYRGIFGHECINEIIVSRLMNLLGIDHLQYKLIHALVTIDNKEYETWLCRSCDFKNPGERKQALDTYYSIHRVGQESPLEMCDRLGFGRIIRQMMLADFLTVNRDRHGANIEILIADKNIRLAPLFDNGISFLAPYSGRPELFEQFDPMQDVNVNNYFGSRSLFENLKFLNGPCDVDGLQPQWKEELFAGIEDLITPAHREKIWEIIDQRWNYYEKICNKK